VSAPLVALFLAATAPAGKSVITPAATYELAVYWIGKAPPAAELKKLVTEKEIVVVPADMKEYAPPNEELLQYFGRGLSPTQVADVQKASAATRFVVLAPAARRFEVYKAVTQTVAAAAKKWKGYPWDEATRELFTPEAWQKTRVEGWKDGRPLVTKHIVGHFYENAPNGHRLVTLGMQKFALPDISVDGAPASYGDDLLALVNLTCALLIEKPELSAAGELDLLKDGKVKLKLQEAKPQDGDAPNALYTVIFPGKGALTARMSALLKDVLGLKDDVISAKTDDSQLNAARDRARAKLPEVKKRLPKLKAELGTLTVKGPFGEGEPREWMWVEVQRWHGDKVVGVLLNEPAWVKGLARGDIVTVDEAEIFDWQISLRDGGTEGGETNRILERRQ
jgi:uncharacterized protein YegJ (DUF2314 family)